MTNEMKLLRAFIAASGYEVETLLDYKEEKLTKSQASNYFKPQAYGSVEPRRLKIEDGSLAYLIDSDGMYSEVLVDPIIDYKVTKKPDNDLIKALDRVAELMYSEYSSIEPDILEQFKKLGWVDK